jgi:hypothetical protein
MRNTVSLFDPAANGVQPITAHALYEEASRRLQARLALIKRDFAQRYEWENTPPSTPPDLITSCLTLQFSLHLEDELRRIYDSLAQGGAFLAVLAGGQTLYELRTSLVEAEVALTGGASPRALPMLKLRTLARDLLEAGFALPVVDGERIVLAYDDLYSLMYDLRDHGCTNAFRDRSRTFTRRALFEKATVYYADHFPAEGGGITATVDLVFLHGWKE